MSDVMRGIAKACSVLILLSGMTTWSASAEATSRVFVSGKVVDRWQAPIAGAKILVDVRLTVDITNDDVIPTYLRSARAVAVTNSQGQYRALVRIPTVPQFAGLQLYVRATKAGPPNSSSSIIGFPLGKQSRQLLRADFNLVDFPQNAQVSGVVRDRDTFDRLQGVVITFSDPATGQGGFGELITDADGEYFGVIPISASTQTLRVHLRSDLGPGESSYIFTPGGARGNGTNGIAYKETDVDLTLNAGQQTLQDFALEKDTNKPLMVGRLLDRNSGKPIPNALVGIEETITGVQGPQGKAYRYSTTDAFGRYQLSVDLPVVSNEVLISMDGALPCFTTARGTVSEGPYACEAVKIIGLLHQGEVFERDFMLIPKQ